MEENQSKSYRTNNSTSNRNISDKNNSTSNNKENDVTNSHDHKNTTEKKSFGLNQDDSSKCRAAFKAGRVNAMYATKPIEQLAINAPIAKDQDVDGLCEGLMFVALSPEKQEKRKSAEAPATFNSGNNIF